MKGIIIYEDYRGKEVVEAIKLGMVNYECKSDTSDGSWINNLSGVREESTQAYCNKEDTYDFKVGALIALMKMCGVDKVKKAAKETFFDVAENSVNEYEEKIDSLEKEIKRLRGLTEDLYKFNCRLVDEKEELMTDRNRSWKNYQRNIQKKQDRINELETQIKASEDDKQKNIEYYEKENKKLKKNIDELFESEQRSKSELGRLYFEKHRLEEEVEKLKLDCEKLCHGYNDTYTLFCGGRQNGKQYTALVGLFKKIDQKKVDEAYKEAYNTTLPVWQKEVLKQMYGVYEESKEKIELPRTLDINGTVYRKSIQIKDFGEQINKLTVDSLIEQSRAFTRKCVDEWLYKPHTKREEMWGNIRDFTFNGASCVEVNKADVIDFLEDLEKEMPNIHWSTGERPTATKPMFNFKPCYEYDKVYFFIDYVHITFTFGKETSRENVQYVTYLPPMRWDLFKKGRLVVKVDTDNYEDFYNKCEVEIGRKPLNACKGTFTVYYKNGTFHTRPYKDDIPYAKKIVNWEDVR